MFTVIDIENTFKSRRYKDVKPWIDMSPYHPENRLVSIGIANTTITNLAQQDTHISNVQYKCFYHSERKPDEDATQITQDALSNSTLLIGHNIKHDLSWLFECGFVFDGEVWDTQLAEYILNRGVTKPLSLKEIAKIHLLSAKKTDLVHEYLHKGISFENIPWEIVEQYGIGDIITTAELFTLQWRKYHSEEHKHLLPTLKMSCIFLLMLIDLERNGAYVDDSALDKLEEEYTLKQEQLNISLEKIAQLVTGDAPIRLSSPDYRSSLFFSRKVIDKVAWKKAFNIGTDKYGKPNHPPVMTRAKFNRLVHGLTEITYKQKAEQCSVCNGKGKIQRIKKDGSIGANISCNVCTGNGIIYTPINTFIAGFRLIPRGVQDVSASGFQTNKENLEELKDSIKNKTLRQYIDNYLEFNAINTYKDTFIEGIRRFKHKNILHTKYNQTVTKTGRLSSSEPNLQNIPRNKTFPIKRAFISRFKEGVITQADYSGLEFRIAGALSGCPKIREDINNPNFDPHTFTRDTINNFDLNLPQIDRQDAKIDTFKPLYGGTSGTPRQKVYYKAFMNKYSGLKVWQEELKKIAVRTKLIRLPTGREYNFPDARRLQNGYVNQTTKIVNYPVQGHATADVGPCGFIGVWREFKKLKLQSLLILTTHDSLDADTHPDEKEVVIECYKIGMLAIPELFKEFYNLDFTFPLAIEIKQGVNAYDMKLIGKYERN